MENKPYLSVIIPAYNEGGRKKEEFEKHMQSIGVYLGEKHISYEVIIVNDGSTDNTVEVVQSFAPYVAKMDIIDRKENKGKWYSVREGFLKAHGKFRLLTDADGATPITNLDNFLKPMEDGEDIIIGSRDLKTSRIEKHQPKWKEFLGNAGNVLIKIMLGLRNLDDTQCGFKVLSEKAVNVIIPIMKVDRWGGDFEMLMLAKKIGFKITEVPVVWIDAGQSLVDARAYINTLKELFQVKIRMITGKYKLKSPKNKNKDGGG